MRKLSNGKWLTFLAIAVVILAVKAWALGPDNLDFWSSDGGGGRSSGGDFILIGTAGQHDAGKLVGGDFELEGGLWNSGAGAVSAVQGDTPTIPLSSKLNAPYPNPFNPATNVSFDMAAPGMVQVKIYNSRGQLVRDLVREELPAGRHVVRWDGKNNQGAGTPSGVYFLRFETAGATGTRKMTLLK